MNITKVLIAPKALEYLQNRGLVKQYQKAKWYILEGHYSLVDLKLRQPKSDEVWYFRVNKQFRAFCEQKDEVLYVYAIDNHQK